MNTRTSKTKRSSKDGLFVFLIVEDGFGSASFCCEADERCSLGENPEARPADDEARDLSEETRSNGAAPRRQCDNVCEGRTEPRYIVRLRRAVVNISLNSNLHVFYKWES